MKLVRFKSRLRLLEQSVGRWAKRLEGADLPEIDQRVQTLLQQQIERQTPNSAQKRLTAHFDDLLSGLDAISSTSEILTMTDTERLSLLKGHRTEPPIVKLFNQLYFHAKLSPRVAQAVLLDPVLSLESVERLVKQVSDSGTLVRWSTGDKIEVQLAAASRLWRQGEKATAKRIIRGVFTLHSAFILSSISRLPAERLRMLSQASLVLQDDTSAQLVDAAHSVRSAFVLWRTFLSRPGLALRALDRLEQLVGRPPVDLLRAAGNSDVLASAVPSSYKQLLGVLVQVVRESPELEPLLDKCRTNTLDDARIAASMVLAKDWTT